MAEWRARGYVPDSDEDEKDSEDAEDGDVADFPPCSQRHNVLGRFQTNSRAFLSNPDEVDARVSSQDEQRGKAPDSAGKEAVQRQIPGISPVEERNSTIDQKRPQDSLLDENDVDDIDELQQDGYGSTASRRLPQTSPPENLPNPNGTATAGGREAQGLEADTKDVLRPSQGIDFPDIDRLLSGHGVNEVIDVPPSTQPAPSSRPGRALRHRNAIQLHPYAIEDEKYRQILKARGLKPLRIAQTQSQRAIDTTEDSQISNLDVEYGHRNTHRSQRTHTPTASCTSPSSESPRSPIFSATDLVAPAGNDGHEFPDVDTLLRAHPRNVVPNGFKRRKGAFTFTKKKRTIPPGEAVQKTSDNRSPSLNEEDSAMVEFPASPPLSSPASYAETRNTIPIFKVPNGVSPVALPTPLTSSEPPRHPVRDLSESDEFHNKASPYSDAENSESSSRLDDNRSIEESSDDMKQIQRRIRGVLPASWLKLDIKSRIMKFKGIPKTRRSLTISDGLQRGLARRKSAPRNAASLAHREISSDEEEPETPPMHNSLVTVGLDLVSAQSDRSSPESEKDLWLDSRFGEVEEDNRVDPMLPSQQRTVPKTRRRGLNISKNSKYNASRKYLSHCTGGHRTPGQQTKLVDNFDKRRRKRLVERPPKLSILDAPTDGTDSASTHKPLPDFLRIAARTARSRRDRGRHSPCRKYLKLATIEDSQEVEHVLDGWRHGRLYSGSRAQSNRWRQPLAVLAGNGESLSPASPSRSKASVSPAAPAPAPNNLRFRSSLGKPKKLQQTLDQLFSQLTTSHTPRPTIRKYKYRASNQVSRVTPSGLLKVSVVPSSNARPAELEGSRKPSEQQYSTFEHGLSKISQVNRISPVHIRQPIKRKRTPKQVMLETKTTRDDSHMMAIGTPLVHTSCIASQLPNANLRETQSRNSNKLGGLDQNDGNFVELGIEPLPAGTKFGGATFIGSGDFHRYVVAADSAAMDEERGFQTIDFQGKQSNLG